MDISNFFPTWRLSCFVSSGAKLIFASVFQFIYFVKRKANSTIEQQKGKGHEKRDPLLISKREFGYQIFQRNKSITYVFTSQMFFFVKTLKNSRKTFSRRPGNVNCGAESECSTTTRHAVEGRQEKRHADGRDQTVPQDRRWIMSHYGRKCSQGVVRTYIEEHNSQQPRRYVIEHANKSFNLRLAEQN